MTCTCIQHSEEYCCDDKSLPCFIIRDDFRDLEALKPSDDAVNVRLTTPSVATMLNTDNIAFTRYESFLLYFFCFWFWSHLQVFLASCMADDAGKLEENFILLRTGNSYM